MIKIEDILDDAIRYLKGEMDPLEKEFFEFLLEEHPHLQEELHLINLVTHGLETIRQEEGEEKRLPPKFPPWSLHLSPKLLLTVAASTLIVLSIAIWAYFRPRIIQQDNGQMILLTTETGSRKQVNPAIEIFGGNSTVPNSNRGKSVCWTPSGDIAFAAMYTGQGALGPYRFNSDSTLDMVFGLYNLESGYRWVRPVGSGVGRDIPSGIAADDQGHLLLTGTFGGQVDFGGQTYQSKGIGNLGPGDFFLAKYTPAGDLMWLKQGGGIKVPYQQTGNNVGMAVTTDRWSNVFFAASYIGAPEFEKKRLPEGGPNEETLIAKYDPNGQFQWSQTITGDYMVHAFDLKTDSLGNVYVSGSFGHHNFGGRAFFGENQVLTSRGGRDIFLAKYSPDGKLLWAQQAGSSLSQDGYDYARGLAVDPDGHCLISGGFVGDAVFQTDTLKGYGGRDIFLAKYDPAGDLLWVRQAGSSQGSGSRNEAANAITTTKDGAIFMTGAFTDTAMFDLDTLVSGDVSNFFIAKFAPTGEVLWAKQFELLDDLQIAEGRSIAANDSNQLVVTGFFSGTIRIGEKELTSSGKEDVFLLLFDRDGNLLSAKSIIYYS